MSGIDLLLRRSPPTMIIREELPRGTMLSDTSARSLTRGTSFWLQTVGLAAISITLLHLCSYPYYLFFFSLLFPFHWTPSYAPSSRFHFMSTSRSFLFFSQSNSATNMYQYRKHLAPEILSRACCCCQSPGVCALSALQLQESGRQVSAAFLSR